MTDLSVERVTDRASLEPWWDIHAASMSHDYEDLPADPFEEFVPRLTATGGHRCELLVARAGDERVAAVFLSLPDSENLGTAEVRLQVRPDRRCRGIGLAVAEAVVRRCRELGRPRLVVLIARPLDAADDEPVTTGERLAARYGGRPALAEIRRTLDLTVPGPAAPGSDESDESSYSLVSWVDEVPEADLGDVARLHEALVTDMPAGDLELDPEVWDDERIRGGERLLRATGRSRVTTAARHAASGRLVGITEITVNRAQPRCAYQWTTLVLAAHRGHSLGLRLKAANHRRFRELFPSAEVLVTWNAVENAPMVAVNDALGFRARERWVSWQADL